MTARTALVWITHRWDPEIAEEFGNLAGLSGPGLPEVWLVPSTTMPEAAGLAQQYPRCFPVSDADLLGRLPYPQIEEPGIVHHSHFPLLAFFHAHPEYDYYWFVEFDVRYTGDWAALFRRYGQDGTDFIATHIRRFRDEPYWVWWKSLSHPEKTIPRDQYVRSYNVFFRISNRGLAFMHDALKGGWRGHNEVTFPTLLIHGGFSVADFGGDGGFVPPGRHNAIYTSHGLRNGKLCPFCTMSWRPSRARPGVWKNKLYHSVKPARMMEPLRERLLFIVHWFEDCMRYYVLQRSS